MKSERKETIKFTASVILLICGLTMGFIGLFLPPSGEIHASVLTFIGETFTFVGAIWGISEHTIIQLAKINKKEDNDYGKDM